jgi:hypothetical protein
MILVLIWDGVAHEKFGMAVFTNYPDWLSSDLI